MIDCHVHLRDWDQSEKETILHGADVASKAGFSAIFDMPNTNPPLTSADLLEKRIKYGQAETKKLESPIFYGVYAGITDNLNQVAEVVEFTSRNFPNCVGLKMFAGNSTGNMGIVTKEQQFKIYQKLTELNYKGVLAVHCEKESLMHPEIFDLQKAETHSLARPEIAEINSIADQIELVEKTGFKGHLHICHISTQDGIKLVKNAKLKGLNISCGATAHHALLNLDAYKTHGIFAKMNPPLRKNIDQKAVFNSLLSGEIDNIESDHAPHTILDKQKGASGVPGFAGTLKLIKTLRESGASEKMLEKLCGVNINAIFGTNFKINVPDQTKIEKLFAMIASSYEVNIF